MNRAGLMSTQPKTVKTLIVDDSGTECRLFAAMLRQLTSFSLVGFVRDGAEAIAYLSGLDRFRDRKSYPFPDLVLLDYRMPRCDGVEVLAHLHHRCRLPSVVLWSNTLEQLDIASAHKLGADLVCKKPSNLHEFTQIIDRLAARMSHKAPPQVHDLNHAAPSSYHRAYAKAAARRHKLWP
jgi:CheY-like chemotaxis protein